MRSFRGDRLRLRHAVERGHDVSGTDVSDPAVSALLVLELAQRAAGFVPRSSLSWASEAPVILRLAGW